jgi:lipoyl(octanoyl) transferase
MQKPVIIRDLGLISYADSLDQMQRFTAERNATTTDEIWLLEHPPVFTLGTNADASHILNAGDTPIVRTDRGGQVTWHGPGQLVVYLLMDIRRAHIGVRELVCRLEQAVIASLENFGIPANGRDGAPGVYCGDAKIGSVGLRIRRNCSYHGISVNVCNDLSPYAGINPCGYKGLTVTRTSDRGGPQSVAELADALLPHLMSRLEFVRSPDQALSTIRVPGINRL